MPTVYIRYFGRFKPSLGTINFWIRKNISFVRKGVIEREEFWNRISPYWQIRNRLINEKKGHTTWKKWAKINPETFGKNQSI